MFERAKAKGQPFDVVITDLGMPGMDGKQVAERVKASSPKTPVVLLTGWGMMLDQEGQGMSNVDALMNKPPRVNELLQVLAKVVRPAAASHPVVVAKSRGRSNERDVRFHSDAKPYVAFNIGLPSLAYICQCTKNIQSKGPGPYAASKNSANGGMALILLGTGQTDDCNLVRCDGGNRPSREQRPNWRPPRLAERASGHGS